MVKLTHREMQVAGLVARGLVNEEVASTLGIKVPTAKNHLWSIYRKIGVENRVQLARWLDAHDAGPGKDEGGCKDGGDNGA
jgi:LuxR family transcriptional regulator of csgAB operon